MDESRRSVLRGAAYVSAVSALGLPPLVKAALSPAGVTPFPPEAVRLRPSPYLTAVESNGVYLLRLEPDRLLHNFRVSAGLPPKGDVYGGWGGMVPGGDPPGAHFTAGSF